MLTLEQAERLRDANLQRCARWHPNGVDDWSPAEWTNAVAGEVGEVIEVILQHGRSDAIVDPLACEIADVLTYLDLLAAKLGQRPGGALTTEWGPWPVDAELYLALSMNAGKLCDLGKKLNRSQSGLVGNGVGGDTLKGLAWDRMVTVARQLATLAAFHQIDVWGAIVRKFDAVSERNGFDIWLGERAS
ncbi:MAG: NTP pyrophosphatase (non-canonical NTP hydrolase) [Maricaulis maris]|jgi:NTP pyrophosphatase (non-canonical NTP hydrolase)